MRNMCMPVVYSFGLSHLSVYKQKNGKAWFKSTLKGFSSEKFKAIKGIRSHIQDLLQELLNTRVESQNSFGTELYWAW